jgi:acyl carrier protein
MSTENTENTEQTIESRVIKVVQTQLCTTSVVATTNLVADLGADSLDVLEVIMAVEDEFHLNIDQDLDESFVTVQNIIDHVRKELS